MLIHISVIYTWAGEACGFNSTVTVMLLYFILSGN